MKWYKQPAALLLILLACTSFVMTVAGLTLKHTVASDSEQVQDTMAIAVPFLLLRGDIRLDADIVPTGTADDPKKELDKETIALMTEEAKSPDQNDKWQIPRYFVAVEEDYFDTALFIGDSRTVGLAYYGRLGAADYFADTGMSSFNLFEKYIDLGEGAIDLHTLLETKQYETVYIMLGINELGYPMESIERKLTEIVRFVCESQPDAAIIMMANLGITRNKEASSDSLSLWRINQLNEIIASFADEQRIFYLDVNPYFSDEGGYLRSDVTGDGVHPYAVEYWNWAIWLKGYGLEEAVK